jgi:hypothetical protein
MRHLKKITENTQVNIDVNDGYEYMLSPENETKAADSFVWVPTPPITIESVEITGMDEFNGYIKIVYSNGDQIEYSAKEKRGYGGPTYDVIIKINNTNVDEFITNSDYANGSEIHERYAGSGTWVNDISHVYKAWFLKEGPFEV